jgi:hypothetical protein
MTKQNRRNYRRIIKKTITRILIKHGPSVSRKVILVLVAFGLLIITLSIGPYFKRDLTTTVTAATESLSFSLIRGLESSWILPPGEFLGEFRDDVDFRSSSTKCPIQSEGIPIEDFAHQYLCAYPESTRLVVTGSADVSLDVTPDGHWSMAIVGTDDSNFLLELRDSEDRLLTTATRAEEFRFGAKLREGGLAGKDADSIRIAIVAASGVIGSHVHYAARIDNVPSDFWQPMLLAGDVTTFGINHPGHGKYRIHSERLDTGDIIQIDTERNIFGQESDDTIWGVASIERQTVLLSGVTEVDQFVIHAVLQTTHRDLSVKRFGSPTGHKIMAPVWSIISRWPNGQQYWVLLISVVLILTFGLQLGDSIRDIRSEKRNKRKKHKKHKKRKKKEDAKS